MNNPGDLQVVRRCPKTGRLLGETRPKLSRAGHPCQRAAILGVLAVAGVAAFTLGAPSSPAFAAANQPSGTAQGVYPGRVIWAHNTTLTAFAGSGSWWDDQYNQQTSYDAQMDAAISNLGGWDAMFHWINDKRYGQDRGYQAGDKIGIKINENNATSHANTTNINANPFTVLALVKSLVAAGVPQADITIGDPSRWVTDNIFNKVRASYPNVQFMDSVGGDGRTKSTYEGSIPFSGSGQTATQIATMFTRSRYVINLALLKGHSLASVTLCGKNFFGATSIKSSPFSNAHGGITPGSWSAFVDYWKHPDLGGKTVLYMIDGTFSTQDVSGAPSARFGWAPFNGGWPSTLLASQDPVAIDSVGMDIYNTQWSGANDWYLNLAAQAGLGVFEHWNNSTEKKYAGIKLVYVCTGGTCATSSCTATPAAPTGLSAAATSASRIELSWSSVAAPANCTVTYSVFRGTTQVATGLTGPSYTDTGLAAATAYSYTVRAVDAAGSSASSATAAATTAATTDTQPPSAPQGISASNVTSTSVTLSWKASFDDVGVVAYDIFTGRTTRIGSVAAPATTVTLSNLTPSTFYNFSVQARDAAGNLSYGAAAAQVTTLAAQDLTPPSAPTKLTWAVSWTAPGATVTLDWSPSTDDVGVVAYDLFFGNFHLGSFDGTTVSMIGVRPGTPYVFTVKARDAAGNVSVASSQITVLFDVGVDTRPPSAPTNLTATNVTSTTVSLQWSPSTDDVGVVIYQVLKDGNMAATSTSTRATVTGPEPGGSAAYSVQAIDAAGNVSAPSSALEVTLTL